MLDYMLFDSFCKVAAEKAANNTQNFIVHTNNRACFNHEFYLTQNQKQLKADSWVHYNVEKYWSSVETGDYEGFLTGNSFSNHHLSCSSNLLTLVIFQGFDTAS